MPEGVDTIEAPQASSISDPVSSPQLENEVLDQRSIDPSPHPDIPDSAEQAHTEVSETTTATRAPEPPMATKVVRQFSKEHSSEERKATADAIRAKRNKYFDEKKTLQERQGAIPSERSGIEAGIEERAREFAEVEETMGGLSENWFTRSLRVIERRRLQKKIGELDAQQAQAEADLQALEREEGNVSETLKINSKYNINFDRAKGLLKDFYEREQSKWVSAPYSKEDLQKYFNEDYLTSLSLDEYKELMRRFRIQSVTHVTRQGIRDHVGHMYHTGGAGEYQNGFKRILEQGEIQSALGIYLKNGAKREAMLRFLGLDHKTKAEAVAALERLGTYDYADKSSVHVAIHEIHDDAYGGETGNEIFFRFPSAYIAANFYFGGTAKWDYASGWWNDQAVNSPDDYRGININAGLVYIPKDAQVDPRNGSIYELDDDNKPTLIKDGEGQDTYQRASNTIPSQEYWEKYFEQNPHLKPNKIMYYSVGDGSETLNDRLFGGTYTYPTKIYPQFMEHYGDPPNLQERGDALKVMGMEEIDAYYQELENSPTELRRHIEVLKQRMSPGGGFIGDIFERMAVEEEIRRLEGLLSPD